MNELDKLAYALHYVSAGWRIYPVSINGAGPDGKKIVIVHVSSWQKGSSTEESAARGWWGSAPAPGIGVDCERSGIVVEDLDSEEAVAWRLQFGSLDDHVVAETAGGGLHVFYRANPERPIRNSAGVHAPGVDTRGVGGTIFLPGTTTGNYGNGAYRWRDGILPNLASLKPVPEHLLDRHDQQGYAVKPGTKPRTWAYAEPIAPDMPYVPGQSSLFSNPNTHELSWFMDQTRSRAQSLNTAHERGRFNDELRDLAGWVGHGAPSASTAEEARAFLINCVEQTFEHANAQDEELIDRFLAKGMAEPWELTPDHDYGSGEDGGAAVEVAPANLPPSFWEARPASLGLIRRVAHQRFASADAVLGGVLARMAACLPPECGPDTGIGGNVTSINSIIALVARSGGGKSSGLSVVKQVMPEDDVWQPHALPLGSGEGVAEAYMGTEEVMGDDDRPKKVRKKVRSNVLLAKDEGAELVEIMTGRQGTTIGSVLRAAWSGEDIGQANGKAETTRTVLGGTYSLGMTIGFQEEVAGRLFSPEEVAKGTVQRFLWLSASDPTIPAPPAESEEAPEPITERLKLPMGTKSEGSSLWAAAAAPTGEVEPSWSLPKLTVPASVKREIQHYVWMVNTGQMEPDPMDSQRPRMRVKLACLLAILDGRTDATEEDFTLADQLYATSCVVRKRILRIAEIAREEQERKMLALRKRSAAADAAGKQEQERSCIPGHIVLLAQKIRDAGTSLPKTEMRIKHRACLDDALGQAVEEGVLRLDGRRYSLT